MQQRLAARARPDAVFRWHSVELEADLECAGRNRRRPCAAGFRGVEWNKAATPPVPPPPSPRCNPNAYSVALPPASYLTPCPQTIARLLITGRDALVKIQDKMAAKQAVRVHQRSLCPACCAKASFSVARGRSGSVEEQGCGAAFCFALARSPAAQLRPSEGAPFDACAVKQPTARATRARAARRMRLLMLRRHRPAPAACIGQQCTT